MNKIKKQSKVTETVTLTDRLQEDGPGNTGELNLTDETGKLN